jgi:hypothetical protein
MGGRARAIAALEQGLQKMDAEQARFESVRIGTPSAPVRAGNELHALVPQTIVLKVKGGRLTRTTHLLAVSADGGKKWWFVDTAPLAGRAVRRVFPDFNDAITLPPPAKPTFTPD